MERSRITHFLRLLKLDDDVQESVLGMGDNCVCESQLRDLVCLPVEEQKIGVKIMSQIPTRPASEVNRIGFAALCDRLGRADAIRFLQQYDLGRGDYTEEREALTEGDTVLSLMEEIKIRRNRQS